VKAFFVTVPPCCGPVTGGFGAGGLVLGGVVGAALAVAAGAELFVELGAEVGWTDAAGCVAVAEAAAGPADGVDFRGAVLVGTLPGTTGPAGRPGEDDVAGLPVALVESLSERPNNAHAPPATASTSTPPPRKVSIRWPRCGGGGAAVLGGRPRGGLAMLRTLQLEDCRPK
jgi:hypothetical protein